MSGTWRRTLAGEGQSVALGFEMAQMLAVGDLVALRGPVGAGKSVLARAIITALAKGAPVEVPSPTFTLVETYPDLSLPVSHFDLYRIEEASEVIELGLDDALAEGAVLVEWPERLGDFLPPDHLEITLSDDLASDTGRVATLRGYGTWAGRLIRARAAQEFVTQCGWAGAARTRLKGDASSRSYHRLVGGQGSAILMDAPPLDPGPAVRDGKPYAAIAGLSTNVQAFLAVNAYLVSRGLSAPQVISAQVQHGLVLLEDFGDLSFDELIRQGGKLTTPYKAALAVLVRLHEAAPSKTLPFAGGTHRLPVFDLPAMLIEVELLVEWFWPLYFGAPCPVETRATYRDLWAKALARIDAPSVLMLRDFHAPNLFWLADREGVSRVGIIDHQDAVLGHPAYDLMSLAQDARNDLPPGFEDFLVKEYRAMRGLVGAQSDRFAVACALLGAQRSAKILGGFTRLKMRDGKPGYLNHIPRIARYLTGNLAHPGLADLKSWFDAHVDLAALTQTGRFDNGD